MPRILAYIAGVVSLGAGVGLLVWGIVSAALGQAPRPMCGIGYVISTSSEAIGFGAGMLTIGITTLVLALSTAECCRRRQ